MRQAHLISLGQTFENLGRRVSFEHYTDGLFTAFATVPIFEDVEPALAGLVSFRTGVVSNADDDHLNRALSRNNLRVSSGHQLRVRPLLQAGAGNLSRSPAPDRQPPRGNPLRSDSQDDDIVGARRAGIRVAWLNRNGEALKPHIPEPHYEISSLQDISGLVS